MKNRIHGFSLRGGLTALVVTLIVLSHTFQGFQAQANSSSDNVKENLVVLDGSGIPIVNYGYIGENFIGPQRNPTTISTTATDHYSIYKSYGNETAREIFLNNSDWLVENAVSHGNYSLLEFKFPWLYDLNPPWRSGMAQALAIQGLIKAHQETRQVKFLDTAKMLLNSFFIEVKDGGVTYKTPNRGWWYEEYASDGIKQSRVLNGMMFALLGIHEYYQYTNDSRAKYLFDQGVVALKHDLHLYNDSEYSYSFYDIFQTTNPLFYHNIHTMLLNELYNLTGEQIFRDYATIWGEYDVPPYLKKSQEAPITEEEEDENEEEDDENEEEEDENEEEDDENEEEEDHG